MRDNTQSLGNPLNPISEEVVLRERRLIEARTAEARTPAEWFDIFEAIIRHGVMSTAKAHGDVKKAEAGMAEILPHIKHVRDTIHSHGLSLAEDIDMEGPEPLFGQGNVMIGVEWPMGQYIKLFWQDKSVIEFRGQNALVAFSFFSWYGTFRQPYEQLSGVQENYERRVIMPGSSEWTAFNKGRPGL